MALGRLYSRGFFKDRYANLAFCITIGLTGVTVLVTMGYGLWVASVPVAVSLIASVLKVEIKRPERVLIASVINALIAIAVITIVVAL